MENKEKELSRFQRLTAYSHRVTTKFSINFDNFCEVIKTFQKSKFI